MNKSNSYKKGYKIGEVLGVFDTSILFIFVSTLGVLIKMRRELIVEYLE